MLVELLVGIVGALFAFYWWRKRQMQFFRAQGIPGPEPNFLTGNLLQLYRGENEYIFQNIQAMTKKYGKTWGYYEGGTPVLVTSDVDMLQQIFIKQFPIFHSRRILRLFQPSDATEEVHMFLASGSRWKRQRMTVNPSFTSSKLKKMNPIFQQCVKHTMEVVEKNIGKPMNIYPKFQSLTLKTIAQCAFGMHLDEKDQAQKDMLKRIKRIFEGPQIPTVATLHLVLPELRLLWKLAFKLQKLIYENPHVWLMERLKPIVQLRKEKEELKRTDLLQQMLDSETDMKLLDLQTLTEKRLGYGLRDEANDTEEGDNQTINTLHLNKLTSTEIVVNSYLFMLAGYETTSTALAYGAYELAKNPQVQRRLQEEIDANLPSKSEGEFVSYETLHGLKYLDWTLNEILRMHPLASLQVTRTCMKDTELCGHKVRAGQTILPDTWSLHTDPELWGPTDPAIFEPERWSKPRQTCAFLTFGAGPRNCIGKRFALLEAKLMIFELLRRYSIVPARETKLELHIGPTITPKEVIVILEHR